LDFGGEGGEELLEKIVGLAIEDDSLGEHAVTGGVLGGGPFAFPGSGAAGTGAVDTGRFRI
jgi:hypothetical protein